MLGPLSVLGRGVGPLKWWAPGQCPIAHMASPPLGHTEGNQGLNPEKGGLVAVKMPQDPKKSLIAGGDGASRNTPPEAGDNRRRGCRSEGVSGNNPSSRAYLPMSQSSCWSTCEFINLQLCTWQCEWSSESRPGPVVGLFKLVQVSTHLQANTGTLAS